MIDLFQPGAYCRAAGGNLERPDIQKPVVQWMAWSLNADNGGNGGTAVWDKARALWKQAGIQDFPWMHVRSMQDLQRLLSVGEAKNSPALGVNIEDVVGDGLSLQEVGGFLLDFWVNRYEKPVHLPTLDWVQNGQGWQYVSFAVAALEFFPGEGSMKQGWNPTVAQQCIDHAQAEGLKKVTPMFKTKVPNTAQTYGTFFSICHSLYTADDITPDAASWLKWKGPTPCSRIEPLVPLTAEQVPYTGPYGPPTSGLKAKGPTAEALKRAMIRMGYFQGDLAALDQHYNEKLVTAMKKWQRTVPVAPASGLYGRGSWIHIRSARVPAEFPHAGEYALDAKAQKLIRDEAHALCYPVRGTSSICQGLHATGGLNGNWAIDFCADAGSEVVAAEDAKITKLSGSDPATDWNDPAGVYGWSIHYETPMGYRYFSTHYGTRVSLQIGQQVESGQKLGEVGDQKYRPDHLHLGVTSPLGETDAKKRITDVSQAPRP